MSAEAENAGRALIEKAKAALSAGLSASVYVLGKNDPIMAEEIELEARTARIATPSAAAYHVALGSVTAVVTGSA